MAGEVLRETVANRIPVFTGDVEEADLVVEAGGQGAIWLTVRTRAEALCSVSIGAEEAVHLIRLLATELANTQPLRGFVPKGV